MKDLIVLKFGGTSVAHARAISSVIRIVGSERRPRVVVVSALAGVTDHLLEIADLVASGSGNQGQVLADLERRHLDILCRIANRHRRTALERQLRRILTDLKDVADSAARADAPSSDLRDVMAATGEIMSSHIIAAALADRDIRAVWVDAREMIVTDTTPGAAVPQLAATKVNLDAAVGPILAGGHVPVMGGFIGATPNGRTTTLGRGGSDLSAAVVGGCLGAAEIQLWSDVDGMLTADPRFIPSARSVPQVSFAAAYELARFGAKVLHPATVEPALVCDIPVRLLNTHRPEQPGTLITRAPATNGPVIALACRHQLMLLEMAPRQQKDEGDFRARVVAVLDRFRASVVVMKSESGSVSAVIDGHRHAAAMLDSLSRFADVSTYPDVGLLAAVGERLHAEPEAVGMVLDALDGMAVRLVTHASPRSIAVVLPETNLRAAMTRVHARLFESAFVAS